MPNSLVAAAAGAAVAASSIGATITLGLGLGFSGAITAGYIAGAVVAMGINMVGSRALAKKPKQLTFQTDASGRTMTVRSAVESHKIIYGKARVAGPLTFVTTSPSGFDSTGAELAGDNRFLHMTIPVAGHEVADFPIIYFNDQIVVADADGWITTAPYHNGTKSFARVIKMYGTPDQVALPEMLLNIPAWGAANRGRGIAMIYIKLEYSVDVFPTGAPNVSVVVKGKPLYDPRTGLTAWSENWALCARDYLASDYGFNCDADEINDTYFIAAANISDESVTKRDGSTQKRFTCNGVVDTASAPLENLSSLLTAGAGAVTYVQGQFRIHAAAYDSPSGDIGTDILAGDVQLQARPARKELFNAVKGTYVDPAKSWQPTDFSPVTNGFYEAADGGERIFKDIELPFTTDPEAAQRIGKIILEKGRQGITVTMPVMHHALKYAVYDVVTLTNPQLGWNAKPFRITRWNLGPPGPITMTLQEESAASYAWNSGEATTSDTAPDTSLPSAWLVAPPGDPSVVEELYAPLDGSAIRSKAIVTWAASTDSFVHEYQVEYRLTSSPAWTVAGRTADTSFVLYDIPEGSYFFQVKAITHLNVSSAYAGNPATINGLAAPPAAITGFSLNAISNNAHLSWNQSSDIDVRVGGCIRLRYAKDIVGATWSGAVDLGSALPGVATQATVPLVNGTYLIKAVDAAGNESVSATTIISTIADIVKMNTIVTTTQDSAFTGAKTNMLVSSGILKLDGSTQFDTVGGNFDDAAGYFDSGGTGGFAPYGEYLFTQSGNDYVDIGKVVTSRLTAAIKANVFNELDTFDQRGGLFDDAMGLFDGDDITGVDVKLYVRTTQDNPASSPAWSAWRQFFVGDYTARAFQFKLAVQSNDSALNVEVSELAVTIDMPDITDSGSLTTGTGGRTAVVYGKTFYAAPSVGGTILNAATGDYFDIQNGTASGFEIGVKDSGGNYVARVVHWQSHGY